MKDSLEQAILPNMSIETSVLVVTGEPSGDRAASAVVKELMMEDRDILTFGVGGEHLQQAGSVLLQDISRMAGIGVGASISSMKSWLSTWARLREAIALRRPRAALLVDSPELNIPLARVLKEEGIPVVYYIGPQVWAWRAGRLKLMKERTDNVALILPFELPLYREARVRAEFVGHPLLDSPVLRTRAEVRAVLHAPEGMPLVAMLPGSRESEVTALAGPMVEAGLSILRKGARPVLAPLSGGTSSEIIDLARANGCALLPEGVTARELLRACDAALVASGTATLEAALEGAPMAVVYKIDTFSWWAARLLVKVPFVGLPNLVAGRAIVPELLQQEVDGVSLAGMAFDLLDKGERVRQKDALSQVSSRLGTSGAATRVADMVRVFLE